MQLRKGSIPRDKRLSVKHGLRFKALKFMPFETFYVYKKVVAWPGSHSTKY